MNVPISGVPNGSCTIAVSIRIVSLYLTQKKALHTPEGMCSVSALECILRSRGSAFIANSIP